jgi:hypothetical protein
MRGTLAKFESILDTVDRFWAYLTEKGFHPDSPCDAAWGERYFPIRDPDGHELSFARRLV